MELPSFGRDLRYAAGERLLKGVVVVFKYHAHGVDIVDLLEGNPFLLHLAEDGVDALHPGLDLTLEAFGGEARAQGLHERIDHPLALTAALLKLTAYH